MKTIFDPISGRYFKVNDYELAGKTNELNIQLAYDEEKRDWKKTQITYNDLMVKLFNASPVLIGDFIKFEMPIDLYLSTRILGENGEPVFVMEIRNFNGLELELD